jgi:hypothetical protein
VARKPLIDQGLALVLEHPVKGQDRTVPAHNPEYAEPTKCIDRHDTAGLQSERHISVTHRAPVAILSKS